jgi:hypothetical protein
MFHTKFVAIAIAAVLLSASAFAANPTFTTIDNPGDPTFNQLLGINKNGVISGYFGSGAAGHPNIGYTVAPPYTKFVSDNLPGSVQTQATGIAMNGTTVGFWAPTNNGAGLDANFGFIREANGFTYLSVNNPLGGSLPQVDQLLGINASNIAVGFYIDAAGVSHGYAYTVKTGVYTPVNVVGAASDAATGINAHNQICGFFTNPGGTTEGFVQKLGNGGGVVTTFTVPGAAVTQLLGINDAGLAVGFYQNSPNDITHGISYNPINGDWNQVDAPNGVGGTVLNGINNSGEAVGFYTDAAGNVHGLLVKGVK